MAAFVGYRKCPSIITKYFLLSVRTTVNSFGLCNFGQQQFLWAYISLSKRYIFHCHQAERKVYFLADTEEDDLNLERPYQTLNDIKQFGVKTVKGGFKRRPELLRQRRPELGQESQIHYAGVTSFGLFDKCERIQQELTETMLSLMNVENKENSECLMLDIGCGHGWSLTVPCLKGFCITGVDLDLQALSIIQNKVYTDYLPTHRVHVVRSDVAYGLCFKENTFDLAISISFLQWLCVGKHSRSTLQRFFRSLNLVLKPGSKAGIQFYPRNFHDVDNVVSEAQKYFRGALVSDFPHLDRGRKLFLVLLNDKQSMDCWIEGGNYF